MKFIASDGRTWEAGEPVFHPGSSTFGTVHGIGKSALYIMRRDGASVPVAPNSVRADPNGEGATLARKLSNLDRGLYRWFIEAYRDGASVADCKARMRAAAKLAGH
jgi:hypothetical protein